MKTETVLEHIVSTRDIFQDPLVKQEHSRRIKYYRTGLDKPPKEIPLEQRYLNNDKSILKVWFGFGGGI